MEFSTAKGVNSHRLDHVQLLSPEEAQQASVSLRQLLCLAKHMHANKRKRGGSWTESFSPAIAKRCKTLGRSPTDAAIDDLTS